MSIYDYTVKKHPAGFKGYRVSVMVAGVHRQKYFTTNGEDGHATLSKYIEARELESEWLVDKEAALKKFTNEAAPTSRTKHSTGVRGISLNVAHSRDRKGNKKGYSHLRYIVQGSHLKEPYHARFPVTDLGWKAAVKFLAQKKKLTRWKHLLERNNG